MLRRRRHRRRNRRVRLAPFLYLLVCLSLIGSGIAVWQERPWPSSPPPDDGLHRYAGAIHVHSRYSDGGGTVDEIAHAAREAGLDFVVLTDHGTVQPLIDGYQGYRDSVLILVGEEVNTGAGHLLALGVGRHVEQQGPGGLPALLDTIQHAGGLSIAAHPDGRHPWTDWSVQPLHGLEILNADSEWRNDHPLEWLQALLWYPFMPEAALNSLMDRPDATLRRWDLLTRQRPAVGIGSVDAHARIPLWGERILRLPSYSRMFRLLRTYVVSERPMTGISSEDQALILDAVRNGSIYTAVDGYEQARGFAFDIDYDDEMVRMGLPHKYRPGGLLRVSTGARGRVLIRVVRNGAPLTEIRENELTWPVAAPGVYRVEVYQRRPGWLFWGETLRPWIFSNPIHLTL